MSNAPTSGYTLNPTNPGQPTTPSPTATQTTLGFQDIINEFTMSQILANLALEQRGQDIDIRGQDINAASANRGQDLAWQQSVLQFQSQAADMANRYNYDMANLGLAGANLNLQKNIATANQALQQAAFKLDVANFGLTQAQFNYQQRAGVADRKLAIIQSIADRRGPQDWVAYANLVDGLNAPNPDKSQTLDMFGILNGLDQQSSITPPEAPALTDLGPDYTPSPPAFVSPGTAPGALPPGAATPPAPPPVSAPSAWNTQQPSSAQTPPPMGPPPASAGWSGVRNEDVAQWGQTGQGGLVTTGGAGPSQVGDYTNFKVFHGNTAGGFVPWDPATPIPGGTNVFLQRLAQGGAGAGMAIVGDDPGGRTGNEELVVGNNFQVMPWPDDQPLPPEAPRMAGGGYTHRLDPTDVRQPSGNYATGFGNTLQSAMPGNEPVAGNGYTINGASLEQPTQSLPADSPYLQKMQPQPQQAAPAQPGGGYATLPYQQGDAMRQEMMQRIRQWQGRRPQGYASGQSQIPRGADAFRGYANASPRQQAAPFAAGAGMQDGQRVPTRMMEMLQRQPVYRAAGGATYGMDPNVTVNSYTPQQLGAQPFIQKIMGQRDANPFGGFGARLANPRLGVTDAPWAVNLKTYNNLAPSEQIATRDFYEGGLGTSFDDQLAQAWRAAPRGFNSGPAGYGL